LWRGLHSTDRLDRGSAVTPTVSRATWTPSPNSRQDSIMTPTAYLLLPIAVTILALTIRDIVRDAHKLRNRRTP
jgi:hypothetical protein